MDVRSRIAAADSLLDVGRVEQAREQATLVLTEDPDNSAAHGVLARCAREVDDYPAMLAAATAAVTYAPSDVEAHILRSQALVQLRRHEDAVDAAQTAVRLSPESAGAHLTYAIALFEARRHHEGWAALAEATRLAPEWATVHYITGEVYRSTGRLRRARRAYELALSLKPDHAGALQGLGQLAMFGGRLGQAVRHFGSAAAISTRATEAVPGVDRALRVLTGQAMLAAWAAALILAFGQYPLAWLAAVVPPAAYALRLRTFIRQLPASVIPAVRLKVETDPRLRLRLWLAAVTLAFAVIGGGLQLAFPAQRGDQRPMAVFCATAAWMGATGLVLTRVDAHYDRKGAPRR